ncbi:MAG: T9SS type A sorting domain-containing protein [Bacteroidales bacterium]|nr:T9SS type A sorting domain-containing protein [Bacteroidales bacterium]
MKKIYFLFAFFLFLLTSVGRAQSLHDKELMDQYDVKEYILDLNISNSSVKISGNVTINAQVTAPVLDTFAVDLIDTITPGRAYMAVDSVKMGSQLLNFEHTNDVVRIKIDSVQKGQMFSVQIFYHGSAEPVIYPYDKGIMLSDNNTESFSLSESRGAKLWWPCKQDLTDKADSVKFLITTDSTNLSGSNGLLVSTKYLPGGKVRYEWKTNYPIDYYLISFAVGPFTDYKVKTVLSGTDDTVLIQSLLNKNSLNYKKNLEGIEVTKKLLNIFSEILGPFPFRKEKYGYVSVDGAPVGGMENQTMTTIGSKYLDSIPTSFGFYNSSWVTAHELAHSWFGDLVTCKSWNDVWINEGFASYMEYVALERLHLDSLSREWLDVAFSRASLYKGSVYVPDSLVNDDNRVFNLGLSYKKGALILHMLRYEINNDSLFFKGLREYLHQYADSTAGAMDFKAVMESVTGMDFTTFFNQWYYGDGYPVFNVNWGQDNDTVWIHSVETSRGDRTTLFKTHIDFQLNFPSGDTLVRLYQRQNDQMFKIPESKGVLSIVVDPKDWLYKLIGTVTATRSYHAKEHVETKIYPNPFADVAHIRFHLDRPETVKVEVFDLRGTRVEKKEIKGFTGENTITVGAGLESGTYFYRIEFSGKSGSGKLIKL